MTRAEEAALKAYSIVRTYNDYVGDYDDTNFVQRIAYEEGYMCAEITANDIRKIIKIYHDIQFLDASQIKNGDAADEILKRFNE